MYRFMILILVSLVLIQCEKGQPVIDGEAILLISASPSSIYNFGDTSIVTVQAVEPDGRPVLDGTAIQLTATGGSMVANARTVDGQAQVVFTSDAEIGDVTITAQSGSLGSDGSISTVISVIDRNIAIGNAVIGLNPSNINQIGGRVQVSITVLDAGGLPLPNKAVVFSTEYGTLASNGLARITNSAGQAFDTLDLENIPTGIDTIQISALVGTQTSSATLSVTQNQNPVPAFSFSPDPAQVGETLHFNGAESTDPDGQVVDWSWYFGDGEEGSGETVSHTYQRAGSFTVTLKITDDRGSSVSTSKSVVVGDNEHPTANFEFTPASPRVHDPILFDGQSSSDPDGQIVSYEWQFLNGITRTGPTVSYAFSGAGTYVVFLKVTDNAGGTHTVSKQVQVQGNQTPSANFIFSPTNPRVGDIVSFDGNLSTDSDGSITSYSWNFGNGSSGQGAIFSTSYSQPGTYQVNLTVRDNDGGLGFSQQTIQVSGNESPVAEFTFSPTTPLVNQLVSFDGTGSYDPDGSISQYQWDFGDGASASGATVSHRYQAPGSYQVALTVRDNEFGRNVLAQAVAVTSGGRPNANLSLIPEAIIPPTGEIVLDGSLTSDPETPMTQLTYRFEAFAPSYATVTFEDGNGPVRQATLDGLLLGDQVLFVMTVRDPDGNEDTDSKVLSTTLEQVNQSPVASFTVSPTSMAPPGGEVLLDATQTTDPDHPESSLTYDFQAFTQGNVTVTMDPAQTGPLRTVDLDNAQDGDEVTFQFTVTDPLGAQDWLTKSVSIETTPMPGKSYVFSMNRPMKVPARALRSRSLSISLKAEPIGSSKMQGTSSSVISIVTSSPRIQTELAPQTSDGTTVGALCKSLQAGDRVVFLLIEKNGSSNRIAGRLTIDIVDE